VRRRCGRSPAQPARWIAEAFCYEGGAAATDRETEWRCRFPPAHGCGAAPLAGGGRWHTEPATVLGSLVALRVGLRTLARPNPDAIDGDDREGCGQFAAACCEQRHHQPCLTGVGEFGETQERHTCRGPPPKEDQLAEVLVRCEQDGGKRTCAFENLIIVDPGGYLAAVGVGLVHLRSA
jgi:hypothetical protein